MELPWTPIYSRPADGQMHDGYCNEFYPNAPTTYARFIWAVRMLTRNGFVVLIDNHLNSDPTVTQNPAQWLQARLQWVLRHLYAAINSVMPNARWHLGYNLGVHRSRA